MAGEVASALAAGAIGVERVMGQAVAVAADQRLAAANASRRLALGVADIADVTCLRPFASPWSRARISAPWAFGGRSSIAVVGWEGGKMRGVSSPSSSWTTQRVRASISLSEIVLGLDHSVVISSQTSDLAAKVFERVRAPGPDWRRCAAK